MLIPWTICLILFWHFTIRASVLAFSSAGNSSPAKTAIMPMTTNNSIMVNAGALGNLPNVLRFTGTDPSIDLAPAACAAPNNLRIGVSKIPAHEDKKPC